MKSRNQYQQERERMARKAEQQMRSKLRGMQARLWAAIEGVIGDLGTDAGGNIRFSVGNISSTDKVGTTIAAFNKRENRTFLSWMFKRLTTLFTLNRKYFEAQGMSQEAVDKRVLRRVMLRYGFDTRTGRVLQNGYLAEVITNTQLAADISRRINDAIAAKVPLGQFRQTFRQDFVGSQGVGMLEGHYLRFTNDLFQEFDRTVQLDYKENLGLDYAVYSGTVMKFTRPFCEARNNNVYKSSTIEEWNSQEWKGKIPGKDVAIQCGGYNCRHHLNWITEELANRLAKSRGGIDKYN